MLNGFYSAATSLDAAERNHEVIAHNLAHIDVPGFRRSYVSNGTFESALNKESGASGPAVERMGTQVGAVQVDFTTPGRYQHTGRQLDVALVGEGFFCLEGQDGPVFTRNGVFQRNPEGELVAGSGLKVLGEGDAPIIIPANVSAMQVRIQQDGRVVADGTEVGRLRVVTFEDNSKLTTAGTAIFAAPEDMKPEEATATIEQGSRELSNVVAIDELVRMIVGMRQYEAAQKAMDTLRDSVQQMTDPRVG